MALGLQGFAQKGMQGVGVNLAANFKVGDHKGIGIGGGIKYQYNITDNIRVEPSFSYYSVSDDAFDMLGFVNMHLFFLSPSAFRPFIFAGPGFLSYSDERYDYVLGSYRKTEKDFGFDGGLGLDYRVTHNLSLQMEVGGLIGLGDDDHYGLKLNIGFCYNF